MFFFFSNPNTKEQRNHSTIKLVLTQAILGHLKTNWKSIRTIRRATHV